MQREITLRFLAEPSDVNFGGKVHGGTVMKWIDQAGYACAVGWSGHYCVTVYVGGIRFLSPVKIGDMVEVAAQIIYTGNTSMHIAVDVFAGSPKSQERRKTTHCIIVFIAMDDEGQSHSVPAWVPESKKDLAMQEYAKKLMELRKGIEQEMDPFR
ncbi:MAG TPA: acyl-CoA thioesterase [Phycisphaerales bacterium]|nr:acyl-CoA thioesterase [Phycisphaerales bacterium]